MVSQTSNTCLTNWAYFCSNTNIASDKFLQEYRKNPELQKKIIDAMPFIKDGDPKSIKKLKSTLFTLFNPTKLSDFNSVEKLIKLSRNIRNMGTLSECQKGLIEFLPSKEKIHKMILFSESKYFCKISLYGKNELLNYDCEKEGQKLVLTYLKSSDNERQKFIRNLTVKQAQQIIFLANYWQITELVEVCDQLICKTGNLDKPTWIYLSSLNLSHFHYINSWLFICRLLSIEDPKSQPYDNAIQQKARSLFDFQKGSTPSIELKSFMLKFLESVNKEDRMTIDFSLKEIKLDKTNINQLYTIAIKFSSIKLLRKCLEFESNQKQIKTQRPGKKEFYVDDYYADNYNPNKENDSQIVNNPSGRYSKQKSFFTAPCPAADVSLILTPQKISDDFLKLVTRYKKVPLGLSLTADQIKKLAKFMRKKDFSLDSIRLLNLNGDIDQCKKRLLRKSNS